MWPPLVANWVKQKDDRKNLLSLRLMVPFCDRRTDFVGRLFLNEICVGATIAATESIP
jgi:hypothetical protein